MNEMIGAIPAVLDKLAWMRQLNEFFSIYQSGDEYDLEAITHVMACTSHFPGDFISIKRS